MKTLEIIKPIDYNTTWKEIDNLELCFFQLFDRMPKIYVTGTFEDIETKDLIFANNKLCEIMKQRKTGKAIYCFHDIDGAPCKAIINNDDQSKNKVFINLI